VPRCSSCTATGKGGQAVGKGNHGLRNPKESSSEERGADKKDKTPNYRYIARYFLFCIHLSLYRSGVCTAQIRWLAASSTTTGTKAEGTWPSLTPKHKHKQASPPDCCLLLLRLQQPTTAARASSSYSPPSYGVRPLRPPRCPVPSRATSPVPRKDPPFPFCAGFPGP
jgi:hypothetical protein